MIRFRVTGGIGAVLRSVGLLGRRFPEYEIAPEVYHFDTRRALTGRRAATDVYSVQHDTRAPAMDRTTKSRAGCITRLAGRESGRLILLAGVMNAITCARRTAKVCGRFSRPDRRRRSLHDIASIPESRADAATAELYADIRHTLRVPVTNLVWRHLATYDGALARVWQCVKPLYLDGRLDADAEALRSPPDLPVLARWGRDTLHAVGLDAAAIASVRDILANYHSTNAPNLLALLAVLACLEDPDLPRRTTPGGPIRSRASAPVRALPPLLDPAALTPAVRSAAQRLNDLGLPPGPRALVAGVPRHLAHWPRFLTLCLDSLGPVSDELARSIDLVHASACARARHFAADLPPLNDAHWSSDVARALRRFTSVELIANYIPKVSILIRALPE